MSLRPRLIEALTNGPASCSCHDATCNSERLDALLDVLTEHADEWVDEARGDDPWVDRESLVLRCLARLRGVDTAGEGD